MATMTILCSLKNINVAFGQKVIFNNASFQIEHGDKIGLIGLNGMGKSTLFKILCERLTPDTSTPPFVFDKATGKQAASQEYTVFLVPQKFELPPKELGLNKVSDYYLFYYPEIKHNLKLLEDLDAKLALNHEDYALIEKRHDISEKLDHLDYYGISDKYHSYLKSFDLENLEADVNDLSGGEQRKVLLALGLTSQANLILWDEPTNHLDFETINLFEDEITKSNSSHIIISHDRYLLSKVTSKIFHISRAQILSYRGTYADYMEHVASEENARKQMLSKLKNSLTRELAWMRQGIKARGTRSKKRVENYHDLASKVSTLKSDAKKSMEILINKSGRKTKKLCEFIGVNFSYDKKVLFRDLNFSLYKDDKIGVLGTNGVGKSTLMKIISMQLGPTLGKIKYADDLKICYFSQLRDELPLNKSPFELLGDGEEFIHFKNGRSIHVATYFQNYLFNQGELHRPLSSFSGGELNRLQLALNLKNEADVWIFDEPTNDLDIESIEILEDKLSSFDGTVIIISHDRTFLENVTNKIWHIENQEIEFFEVGYSQVAPYLEACKIEKDFLERNEKDSPKEVIVEVKKLDQQEKMRLEKLPTVIEEQEKSISEIEEILARFDYSSMDAEKSEIVGKLTSRKEALEEGLLSLYEELEGLESRA